MSASNKREYAKNPPNTIYKEERQLDEQLTVEIVDKREAQNLMNDINN